MPKFEIGAPVLRIEDRPERRATVLAVAADADEPLYRIAYAEGGDGWWPEGALADDAG